MSKLNKFALFFAIISLTLSITLPKAYSEVNIKDLPKATPETIYKYKISPLRIYQYAKQNQVRTIWYLRNYLDMVDNQDMTAICYAQIAKDIKAYNLLKKAGASTSVACHDNYYRTSAKSEVKEYVDYSGALLKGTLIGGAIAGVAALAGGGGGGGSKATCPEGYSTEYQSVANCGTTGTNGWIYMSDGSIGEQLCGKCEAIQYNIKFESATDDVSGCEDRSSSYLKANDIKTLYSGDTPRYECIYIADTNIGGYNNEEDCMDANENAYKCKPVENIDEEVYIKDENTPNECPQRYSTDKQSKEECDPNNTGGYDYEKHSQKSGELLCTKCEEKPGAPTVGGDIIKVAYNSDIKQECDNNRKKHQYNGQELDLLTTDTTKIEDLGIYGEYKYIKCAYKCNETIGFATPDKTDTTWEWGSALGCEFKASPLDCNRFNDYQDISTITLKNGTIAYANNIVSITLPESLSVSTKTADRPYYHGDKGCIEYSFACKDNLFDKIEDCQTDDGYTCTDYEKTGCYKQEVNNDAKCSRDNSSTLYTTDEACANNLGGNANGWESTAIEGETIRGEQCYQCEAKTCSEQNEGHIQYVSNSNECKTTKHFIADGTTTTAKDVYTGSTNCLKCELKCNTNNGYYDSKDNCLEKNLGWNCRLDTNIGCYIKNDKDPMTCRDGTSTDYKTKKDCADNLGGNEDGWNEPQATGEYSKGLECYECIPNKTACDISPTTNLGQTPSYITYHDPDTTSCSDIEYLESDSIESSDYFSGSNACKMCSYKCDGENTFSTEDDCRDGDRWICYQYQAYGCYIRTEGGSCVTANGFSTDIQDVENCGKTGSDGWELVRDTDVPKSGDKDCNMCVAKKCSQIGDGKGEEYQSAANCASKIGGTEDSWSYDSDGYSGDKLCGICTAEYSSATNIDVCSSSLNTNEILSDCPSKDKKKATSLTENGYYGADQCYTCNYECDDKQNAYDDASSCNPNGGYEGCDEASKENGCYIRKDAKTCASYGVETVTTAGDISYNNTFSCPSTTYLTAIPRLSENYAGLDQCYQCTYTCERTKGAYSDASTCNPNDGYEGCDEESKQEGCYIRGKAKSCISYGVESVTTAGDISYYALASCLTTAKYLTATPTLSENYAGSIQCYQCTYTCNETKGAYSDASTCNPNDGYEGCDEKSKQNGCYIRGEAKTCASYNQDNTVTNNNPTIIKDSCDPTIGFMTLKYDEPSSNYAGDTACKECTYTCAENWYESEYNCQINKYNQVGYTCTQDNDSGCWGNKTANSCPTIENGYEGEIKQEYKTDCNLNTNIKLTIEGVDSTNNYNGESQCFLCKYKCDEKNWFYEKTACENNGGYECSESINEYGCFVRGQENGCPEDSSTNIKSENDCPEIHGDGNSDSWEIETKGYNGNKACNICVAVNACEAGTSSDYSTVENCNAPGVAPAYKSATSITAINNKFNGAAQCYECEYECDKDKNAYSTDVLCNNGIVTSLGGYESCRTADTDSGCYIRDENDKASCPDGTSTEYNESSKCPIGNYTKASGSNPYNYYSGKDQCYTCVYECDTDNYWYADTDKDYNANIFTYDSQKENSVTCYQPKVCADGYYNQKITGIAYEKEEGDKHGNITCYKPSGCATGYYTEENKVEGVTYGQPVQQGDLTCYKATNVCANDWIKNCTEGFTCNESSTTLADDTKITCYQPTGCATGWENSDNCPTGFKCEEKQPTVRVNNIKCQYISGCNNGEKYITPETCDTGFSCNTPVKKGNITCAEATGCKDGFVQVANEEYPDFYTYTGQQINTNQGGANNIKCKEVDSCNNTNYYYNTNTTTGIVFNKTIYNKDNKTDCYLAEGCDKTNGYYGGKTKDNHQQETGVTYSATITENGHTCYKVEKCDDTKGYYDNNQETGVAYEDKTYGGTHKTCYKTNGCDTTNRYYNEKITGVAYEDEVFGTTQGLSCYHALGCDETKYYYSTPTEEVSNDGNTYGTSQGFECYNTTGCNNANKYYQNTAQKTGIKFGEPIEIRGQTCYKATGCDTDNNYFDTSSVSNATGITCSATQTSIGATNVTHFECCIPMCDNENRYYDQKITGVEYEKEEGDTHGNITCYKPKDCDNTKGYYSSKNEGIKYTENAINQQGITCHLATGCNTQSSYQNNWVNFEGAPTTGWKTGNSSTSVIQGGSSITCTYIDGCQAGWYRQGATKPESPYDQGFKIEKSKEFNDLYCEQVTGCQNIGVSYCPKEFICEEKTYLNQTCYYLGKDTYECNTSNDYYKEDECPDGFVCNKEVESVDFPISLFCYQVDGCADGYYTEDEFPEHLTQGTSDTKNNITCIKAGECNETKGYYDECPTGFVCEDKTVGNKTCQRVNGCADGYYTEDEFPEHLTQGTSDTKNNITCIKAGECNETKGYYDECPTGFVCEDKTIGNKTCKKAISCDNTKNYFDTTLTCIKYNSPVKAGNITCYQQNGTADRYYTSVQEGFSCTYDDEQGDIKCYYIEGCDTDNNWYDYDCPQGFKCDTEDVTKDNRTCHHLPNTDYCNKTQGYFTPVQISNPKDGIIVNSNNVYIHPQNNLKCYYKPFSCDTAEGWGQTVAGKPEASGTIYVTALDGTKCYKTCEALGKYNDKGSCEGKGWNCQQVTPQDSDEYYTYSGICWTRSGKKTCTKGYTTSDLYMNATGDSTGYYSGETECKYAVCLSSREDSILNKAQPCRPSQTLPSGEVTIAQYWNCSAVSYDLSATESDQCCVCPLNAFSFSPSDLDGEYITYMNEEGDFEGLDRPLASSNGSKEEATNRTFDLYNSASSASITGLKGKGDGSDIANAYATTDENSIYSASASANATLNITQTEGSSNNVITGIKSEDNVYNAYAKGNASANATINITDEVSTDNIIYGLKSDKDAYNAYAENGANASASININTKTNKEAYGIYAKGDVYNTSNNNQNSAVNITHEGKGDIYGLYSESGDIKNSGDINITSTEGKAYGIYLRDGEGNVIENTGNINIETQNDAYGIYVKDAGSNTDGVKIYNQGTIDIDASDNSRGIKIENNGYNAYVENTGTIKVNGDVNGVSAIDLGGAILMNRGVLSATNSLSLDSFNATHILDGGTYIAESISGSTLVSINSALNNNEDELIQKDSFIAEDVSEVDIKHQSTMYDTKLVKNENDNFDAVSTRKNFNEFTENKSLSDYLEKNYKDGKLNELYNTFKSTSESGELKQKIQQASGSDFLGLIPQENIQTLRHVQEILTDSILKPTDKIRRIVGGADSYRLEREESSMITGYDNNTTTTYMYGDMELNTRNRLGLGLALLRSSTSYDNGVSRKENFINIFVPWIHRFKDNLNLASIFNLGYGFGHFDRSNNRADIKDYVYGFTNRLSYNINLNNVAELEPQLFFNTIGYYQSDMKEEGTHALRIKQGNHTSVEAGFGLFLKKMLLENEKHKLSMKLGAAYYHEFLDPFSHMSTGFVGGNGVFRIDDADLYDHDRAVLEATIDYEYKAIDMYLKYYHLIQKNKSQIFDFGVKYNF